MSSPLELIDPKLDLVLERVIDVPPELVWAAWTQPELLKQWFCPKPWRVSECELDVRPGGMFRTVMQGPEGQEFPNVGCYLEVVPNKRLTFTGALLPGFRPAPVEEGPVFTGVISLEPEGSGTRYVAIALHRDEAGRSQHEAMGFHTGWNAALDQLVELAKSLR